MYPLLKYHIKQRNVVTKFVNEFSPSISKFVSLNIISRNLTVLDNQTYAIQTNV